MMKGPHIAAGLSSNWGVKWDVSWITATTLNRTQGRSTDIRVVREVFVDQPPGDADSHTREESADDPSDLMGCLYFLSDFRLLSTDQGLQTTHLGM